MTSSVMKVESVSPPITAIAKRSLQLSARAEPDRQRPTRRSCKRRHQIGRRRTPPASGCPLRSGSRGPELQDLWHRGDWRTDAFNFHYAAVMRRLLWTEKLAARQFFTRWTYYRGEYKHENQEDNESLGNYLFAIVSQPD